MGPLCRSDSIPRTNEVVTVTAAAAAECLPQTERHNLKD